MQPAKSMRGKIATLENSMSQWPQADIPVFHVFHAGMYSRTIHIKAGTVLTGAIHLYEQLNIVSGDITIITEEGEKRYTGTHVVPSPAGTKRVGEAHADTIWTTILRTDLTDVKQIESEMIATSFDDPRLLSHTHLELIGE